MRCLTYFARVLAICAICLGAVAFMGCSGSGNSLATVPTDNTTDNAGSTGGNDNAGTQSNTSTGFSTVLPGPTFPTEQDFALATARPEHKWDGLATLAPFSINACTGRIIKASGEKELRVCSFEDTVSSTDALNSLHSRKHNESPLGTASDFSSVKSLLPIIFSEGRNLIGLDDDSDLDLGQFNGTLTNPLFNTKVKHLNLLFDVFDRFGEPEWTLPSCVNFTSVMANGKSVIQGSKLVLTWNPDKGSIPPHDRAYVVAIIAFFNNHRLIAVVKKAVPIINNTATYCTESMDTDDPTIYFDTIDVCFDLTKCVPFAQIDGGAPAAP